MNPAPLILSMMNFAFFIIVLISAQMASSFQLLSTDLPGRFDEIKLSKVVGPESIAFDCKGEGPYVGVSDGRILKWQGPQLGWSEFAFTTPNRKRELCDGSTDPAKEQTCGRPLGLKFNNATCELYIADAYYGLLKVGMHGGAAERLASSFKGVPFKLANGLDVDSTTGEVYFTDSSVLYQRREYILAIVNGDRSGRVMKYNPRTKKVMILLRGLAFPNGLALSKDGSFLVVAETGKMQLLRFWLKGPRARTLEVFSQLGRYPDNIKNNQNGDFWVALNSGRGSLQKAAVDAMDKKSVAADVIPWFTRDPVAIKFDRNGRVIEVMDGKYETTFESVSEVEEHSGTLWIGSVTMPFLGKFKP